ncbi:hypothetical protein L228DRAFT_148248 [Xylona heveae TC161]|uniref:Vacuolar import and degradation protein-domain-containing protein n=1 Tax=Xylona heveae (strain CBS 132557 / TC161) TaxID=1328760 RepID=A0A165GHV9_XYLHT|nr:hypothetical protein L228DRAFT_148248 [Xylona heveae TC161]KZF22202.1 hypothetical protein L228DRAFT_148248 [Xylona heveae TC161]
MPPANSPLDTPSENASAGSGSFISELQQLDSPVLDLASTLTTQAEEDANQANINFLRTPPVELDDEPSTGFSVGDMSSRDPQLPVNQQLRLLEMANLRRLRRMRQYTPEQLREIGDYPQPAYGNRVPQQQSLYDWAPGTSDEDEDDNSTRVNALSQLVSNSDIENIRGHRDNYRPPGAGTSRSAASYASRAAGDHHQQQQHNHALPSESSLRTAALLQSVRRHPRFSARSRDRLQSYILDRERIGHETEDRDRASSARIIRPPSSIIPSNPRELQTQRDIRARVDAYRQRYLQNPSGNPPAASRWLEEAIKYLERLRYSTSYEESIVSAAAGGLVGGDFFTMNREDFIVDTTDIDPPAESSWLQIGGVFSGSQQAAPLAICPIHRATQNIFGNTNLPIIINASSGTIGTATTTNETQPSPWGNMSSSGSAGRQHGGYVAKGDEEWPVKVTINSVDYENMTLSGTMEAFNVPDKSSATGESSIVTFLEGELVDFNKYTLETKSFKSDAKVDGTYWSKLEPFKDLSDDDIVRNLVSRRWLKEELAKNWILMRWKEKCFITPSDHRSGLTISGFYYISMRRDTGHVEGLYYDPSSSPYQHLVLRPQKPCFPSYQFR